MKNIILYSTFLILASIILMSAKASADCRGCCSWHGGVCCINGVTKCCDGTPLSAKCVAKGCDVCGNTYEPDPPDCDFYADPTQGESPLLVNFYDTSRGDIHTYEWDFGDEAKSYKTSPEHKYDDPGEYTVSLYVSGPDGSDEMIKRNYIQVKPSGCLVIKVIDGDTFDVRCDGDKETIRLYGVDCPESNQAYGDKATSYTTSQILNKEVKIDEISTGYYGRTIAMVYHNGKNINESLIRNCLAWVYTDYCEQSICNQWENIEQTARNNKCGLWAGANPIPPWEWRNGVDVDLDNIVDSWEKTFLTISIKLMAI